MLPLPRILALATLLGLAIPLGRTAEIATVPVVPGTPIPAKIQRCLDDYLVTAVELSETLTLYETTRKKAYDKKADKIKEDRKVIVSALNNAVKDELLRNAQGRERLEREFDRLQKRLDKSDKVAEKAKEPDEPAKDEPAKDEAAAAKADPLAKLNKEIDLVKQELARVGDLEAALKSIADVGGKNPSPMNQLFTSIRAFDLPTTDNATFKYDGGGSDYLVLCFWNSQNRDSANAFDLLAGAAAKYKEADPVSFLAVNLGDPREDVVKLCKRPSPKLKLGLDTDGKGTQLAQSLGVSLLPVTYLVDPTGMIRRAYVGNGERLRQWERDLSALQKEKDEAAKTTDKADRTERNARPEKTAKGNKR